MLFRSAVALISLAFVCQAALLPKTNGPVLVELYYESLCPYCKEFINEQLFPTFTKLANTGDTLFRLFNLIMKFTNFNLDVKEYSFLKSQKTDILFK